MNRILKKIKEFFKKMFSLGIPKFSRIIIYQSVIDNIIDFAKANYPKEFVAYLSGKVQEDKLIVDGLLYQPFQASKNSTVMRAFLPNPTGVIGSVHSHPAPYSKPSGADIHFFNKEGMMHLIIGYPYEIQYIVCYDFNGNRIAFEIDKNK